MVHHHQEQDDAGKIELPKPLARYGIVELSSGIIKLPGQGCRDPETDECAGLTRDPSGSVVSYDIAAQTRGVFENIERLLGTIGLNRSHLVDVTVFMRDKSDFATMNAVYSMVRGYLTHDSPVPKS